MSGVGWKAIAGAVSTTTSLLSILRVKAASNHAILVKEWGISFNGTSNTAEPILVQLARQTTDGTFTSVTPVKDPDDTDETLQVTAGKNASAEPTPGDILWQGRIHPQNGFVWQAPYGEAIKVGGGDRLAIVTTAPASVTCDAYMRGEE
jgi:hypothetical protein